MTAPRLRRTDRSRTPTERVAELETELREVRRLARELLAKRDREIERLLRELRVAREAAGPPIYIVSHG